MCLKYMIPVGVILMTYQVVQITSRVELTNLKCMSFDKEFVLFDYCRIKSVNRTYKYASLNISLLQVPVTNASVNVVTYRRWNGYRPSMYNFTVDACKFLASTNKNPLINYFYSFFSSHSNMNHTCPYDHDLIVDRVTIDFFNHQLVNVLPVPKGDHAVYSNWYAYGKKRAEVRVYVTLS